MFNYLYLHKERMIKSLKSMSVAYELTTLEVIIWHSQLCKLSCELWNYFAIIINIFIIIYFKLGNI
jgi:hypothetical protein